MESGLILLTVKHVAVVQGSLVSLPCSWLHLEVGGENVLALRNQLPKVVSIAFHGHLNATRLNILRPTHQLDASPHGRDAGILEPNPEFGG
jgi:hypothetical protein